MNKHETSVLFALAGLFGAFVFFSDLTLLIGWQERHLESLCHISAEILFCTRRVRAK